MYRFLKRFFAFVSFIVGTAQINLFTLYPQILFLAATVYAWRACLSVKNSGAVVYSYLLWGVGLKFNRIFISAYELQLGFFPISR
jgi:hypothetical protein